ncbi:MAG: CHAP domain-containing protein [Pseudotabrizicola sp.]|nr:CHAP domain-containing protein [Pseudotabrizicola sp.]MDO8881842.1 CHAP domain-containing protein [Pseudotabrizicola sp.]MDZ7572536.1 CHAP domain-containing protein [Pseudotabrizicola sp.]
MLTACGDAITKSTMSAPAPSSFNPMLQAQAISEVKEKQARGARVWCVPFARTASGVELKGNAGTWWKAAKGVYFRGSAPEEGAVMVFAPHSSSRLGHVAVVSEVVSERKVLIDHANWHRNQISLKMPVIDVSENNDWSRVQVEGTPGVIGNARPLHGFVYPRKIGGDASQS